LNAAQKITSAQIFDLSGKEILHLNGGFENIDISHLNSGIYMLKITADNGAADLVKLIIKPLYIIFLQRHRLSGGVFCL